MIHFLNFLTAVLLTTGTAAYGQSTGKKQYLAEMEIIVEDPSMLRNATIEFDVSNGNISSDYLANTELLVFKIESRITKIRVPLSKMLCYAKMSFQSDGEKYIPLNALNNLFILEDRDNIRCSVSAKEIRFSGEGSEKYSYLIKASDKSIDPIVSSGKALDYFHGHNYEKFIYEKKYQIDSLFSVLNQKLDLIKPLLSKDAYQLIQADNWARQNEKFLNNLIGITTNINNPDPEYYRSFVRVYRDFLEHFSSGQFSPEILEKSYSYCAFLYEKEKWDIILKANPNLRGENRITFKDLTEAVISNNSGSIRDKTMLIAFNKEFRARPGARDCIQLAIDSATDGKYRNELEKFKVALIGSAFPFAMPDKNGKIHRLADFKGKLIVMDFWFTGCHPCMELAKAMKPIVEHYRSDPNIVFITVSIDGRKKKEIWLTSLKEQDYTSDDEINLLAEDGIRSAMIKYYNIMAYPTLFIISKDGKMLTTAPTRPFLNDEKTNREFTKVIEENL